MGRKWIQDEKGQIVGYGEPDFLCAPYPPGESSRGDTQAPLLRQGNGQQQPKLWRVDRRQNARRFAVWALSQPALLSTHRGE